MSRILVVDDARVARESLARLLASAGHAAVMAANGREAWLTLYEGAPDLILLDLMMPQMDGITFLKLLRHSDHWSRVPVVVVTGFADDEGLVREAKGLGVAAVLAKMDCDGQGIVALVERTLARTPASLPCHRSGSPRRRGLACSAG